MSMPDSTHGRVRARLIVVICNSCKSEVTVWSHPNNAIGCPTCGTKELLIPTGGAGKPKNSTLKDFFEGKLV